MADMDENDEIEQQVSDGDSEESPKDESASAEGQKSDPSPEEKEMMAMAEESSDEASSSETPDNPDEASDKPAEADNAAEEGEGGGAADEVEPPAADRSPDDLLDQDDVDNVLKEAGAEGEGEGDSAEASLDTPADEIGGFTDPEVKQADFQQLSSATEEGETKNIELLMDVELPISIELGKTKMNISDILGLAPGSIVELDKLVGEPVDLLVNQRCVAKGEVVVVEENFGLRITQLVSPEERLRNLQ